MTVMLTLSLSEAQDGGPLDETVGPFEYAQITYQGLHCETTDGQMTEFYMNPDSGMWYPVKKTPYPKSPWVGCGPDLDHHGWTDIAISAGNGAST